MDRSSLEGLQHGFDSGCNSRVWAGRGEKESCAHRWIFFTPTRPLAQEENARTASRTADRGHGVGTSQTPAIHPRPERNSGEPTERRTPGHHRRERDSGARERNTHTLLPLMKRESRVKGGAKRVPVDQIRDFLALEPSQSREPAIEGGEISYLLDSLLKECSDFDQIFRGC